MGISRDRQGDVHVNGALRGGAKNSVAPRDRQKVPLSCLFFVAIQQRQCHFGYFFRAKT